MTTAASSAGTYIINTTSCGDVAVVAAMTSKSQWQWRDREAACHGWFEF
jgi:hypothetical protein